MLIVSIAGAQADPSAWKSYTVKDEQFTVALPVLPSMDYSRLQSDSHGDHLEITLSSFADGVVYIIHVFENLSPRQSLDSFIKDRGASSSYPLNRKTKREVTVDGVSGKTFSFDGMAGAVQFLSKDNRLFRFAAFGAPHDDVRVTKFFSSISLNNKNAVEIPITAPRPYWFDPPTTSDAPEKIFTPQEVDKKFQVVMNFHPEYTELARQNRIEGTIVIKCTLAADGTVRNIRVVSALPYGLTERAIASTRKLKFIPAMKDGKYVSVSTQHVYNFHLF